MPFTCVTETVWVPVQPEASLTITVYVPVASPVAIGVVCPLVHRYVYAGFPPAGFADAVPVFAEQEVWVLVVVTLGPAFALTTITDVSDAVQKVFVLVAMSVTVYVPAAVYVAEGLVFVEICPFPRFQL
jgi:hypothetical protein